MRRHEPKRRGRLTREQFLKYQAIARQQIERGIKSEDRVAEALEFLVMTGHFEYFEQTEKNDKFDMRGIDFFIFPDWDWCIPLQVKSSQSGYEKHTQLRLSRIPVILAGDSLTREDLAQKILEAIGFSVKRLKEIVGEPLIDAVARSFREETRIAAS